jgi:heme exporter protein C
MRIELIFLASASLVLLTSPSSVISREIKLIVLKIDALVLLALGFDQAIFASPPIDVPVAEGQDPAVMSNIFRIFYYHVSSAWTAFLLFFANFAASAVYLLKRSGKADAFALATAEVGLVFCTVVLVTGPIWAKPVWGIWWTWDARLTTTLILWLIYASYMILRKFSVGGQGAVLAAALAIFGFLDVPIVYMSIRWFRTQHPQPVIGGGAGSGIHPAMLKALMINFAAWMALAALLVWARYRLEQRRQELEEAYALCAEHEVADQPPRSAAGGRSAS